MTSEMFVLPSFWQQAGVSLTVALGRVYLLSMNTLFGAMPHSGMLKGARLRNLNPVRVCTLSGRNNMAACILLQVPLPPNPKPAGRDQEQQLGRV